MDIDPQILNNVVLILTSLGVAFIAALWLSIVFWVIRDIRSRTRDPLMGVMSVLLVIVLPIFGIVIYLIVRPAQTIEHKYQAALEEEALLQDIGLRLKCPGCGRPIEADWVACPACHTRIKKMCVSCGKTLELQWNLCPYCGSPQQKVYKPEKSRES